MNVQRLAAFADGIRGGNPAGLLLCRELPDASRMQAVAVDVGYSETAFAAPVGKDWQVRYFSPAIEVPFCGHATIALGAALAMQHGDGVFRLRLNEAVITVEGRGTGGILSAALQSPPTRSAPADEALTARVLDLFGYSAADLDQRLPPAIADAGARHLVLPLRSRKQLAAMRYDLDIGRVLMAAAELVTISLVWAERPDLFHARNAFASGGIYEDPATGAAAAALAGYLREVGWPHGGGIEIHQGDDMGMPSRIRAEIPRAFGSSIRVSGKVRPIVGWETR